MKKTKAARIAFTWAIGYVAFVALLPVKSWLIKLALSAILNTAIVSTAICWGTKVKRKERRSKLVDWTLRKQFQITEWNEETGELYLMRLMPKDRWNMRLEEQILQLTTFKSQEKKNLLIQLEGFIVQHDGKTILEEEEDGLLLKREDVWLKVSDNKVVRKFFASAS